MKLLVWDFDGTLGHCDGLWSKVIAGILDSEKPGHTVSLSAIAATLETGFPWQHPETPHDHLSTADEWWLHLDPVLHKVFVQLGLDEAEEISRLAALVRPRYCDITRWRLFPDTLAALTLLSARGWTHVLLSNHVPELEKILEGLGIRDRFLRIVNSAVTGYEKPHPTAFEKAVEGLGIIDECWMIGDSYTADFLGSSRAGWRPILVRRHHPEAQPYFDSLETLPDFLR